MYRRATFSTVRTLLKAEAGSVPPIAHAPGKIPIAEIAVPKKTHRIRNFFLLSSVALGALYAGGTYYALDNDDIYDVFTEYAPGGAALVALADDWRYKKDVSDVSPDAKRVTIRPPTNVVASKAAAKEAKSKDTPKPSKPTKVAESTSAPASRRSQAAAKTAAAPTTAQALPQLTAPEDLDPVLGTIVESLNECVKAANSGSLGEKQIRDVLASIQEVSVKVHDIRDEQATEVDKQLAIQAKKFHQLSEEQLKKLQTAFVEQKRHILDVYNERLKNEIEATKKAVLAKANTALLSQYIELQDHFAKEVVDRVEAERGGRLGQLSALTDQTSTLGKSITAAGDALSENDSVVQFYTVLNRLQSSLSGDAVPVQPFLEQLQKALPQDKLVKATVDSVSPEVRLHGVLSSAQLAARFALIAPEIRQAALAPPEAGVVGHLASRALSTLLVKKQGMPTGTDVESVLARTETFLSRGDVINAVAEVNSLQGWPKAIAADWLSEGRKRGELEFIVNVLSEEGHLWSISK